MIGLGILIGAWVYSRHGWGRVFFWSAVFSTATVLDKIYGAEAGKWLAEQTLRLTGATP
jgi:hypothetical protein